MPFPAARVLNAVFADRMDGRAAIYTPPGGGASVTCTILLNAADALAQIGPAGLVASHRIVEVRASEVERPLKGGIFALGSENLRIAAAPRRDDPDQMVWTCSCDPMGSL